MVAFGLGIGLWASYINAVVFGVLRNCCTDVQRGALRYMLAFAVTGIMTVIIYVIIYKAPPTTNPTLIIIMHVWLQRDGQTCQRPAEGGQAGPL